MRAFSLHAAPLARTDRNACFWVAVENVWAAVENISWYWADK